MNIISLPLTIVTLTILSSNFVVSTHATSLLLEGINPKIVAERLGHSKVSVTLDIYSHVLPNMQKEAAEKLNKTLFG
ncbi:hypothetical protein N7988_28105 (plasmid) [Bacillus cereus]|nr:hypothetical protein [Bacillus cereus]MCU7756894.1 hypothetical protein [Bacillus cereus]MDC7752534.1 hypothetical protein [Bacillus cereus]MEB8704651.1 hypothetical protein [Bacillus cereus]UXP17376.1 hypothetical protein N7988_28105 [Bacillus cereus]